MESVYLNPEILSWRILFIAIMKTIEDKNLDRDKLGIALQEFRDAKEEFIKVIKLANKEHILVKKSEQYIQYIDVYITFIDTVLKNNSC
ncbi:hypothetical protein PCC6912_23310 [Chlorogloeopsis fritschii PCC 6912]|uniref:Uncharacterized protein n=2 Tax=Chlorogloeopsis fritschii TaxID=1124 RepID=A0A3S0Y3H6_CHLFR|nr:hypothetical protein PCC6912_23310 [Chlorogloeopsis fritschii PCC 6912]